MTSKLLKTMVKRKQLPILYHSNKLELLMRILYIIISKRHTSSSSTRHLNETDSKAVRSIRSNRPRWTAIELDYRIGLTHVGYIYIYILDKKNIGFDRDDGLVIIKDKSAGLVDKTRKKLHKVFEQFGLKITGKVNFLVANFLDGTLDLTTGKHNLYRKPNDDLLHV